jgi:hypothetical protein
VTAADDDAGAANAKGQSTPSGNTQFQFHAAKLDFASTSYDWLVVAGAKAQYKGTGTVNGNGEFGFLLTATDGDVKGGSGVDKFRIKIWNKATGKHGVRQRVGRISRHRLRQPAADRRWKHRHPELEVAQLLFPMRALAMSARISVRGCRSGVSRQLCRMLRMSPSFTM